MLHNRAGNDLVLGAVRAHPQRFVGFAVANPWYGRAAEEEMRRALGEGLRGLKLHPVIQGFSPNDPLVYPLVEIAADSDVPVYVHSGTAHYGEPFKTAELARRFPQVTFVMGHAGASDFWYNVPRCQRLCTQHRFRNFAERAGQLCAHDAEASAQTQSSLDPTHPSPPTPWSWPPCTTW